MKKDSPGEWQWENHHGGHRRESRCRESVLGILLLYSDVLILVTNIYV